MNANFMKNNANFSPSCVQTRRQKSTSSKSTLSSSDQSSSDQSDRSINYNSTLSFLSDQSNPLSSSDQSNTLSSSYQSNTLSSSDQSNTLSSYNSSRKFIFKKKCSSTQLPPISQSDSSDNDGL